LDFEQDIWNTIGRSSTLSFTLKGG